MFLSTDKHISSKQGAVLLMVLGIIMISSWMVIQIIARVNAEISRQGVESQNDALITTAFQTLELTIGVLAEIATLDGGLYGPAQGWRYPLQTAGVPMANTVTNELQESEKQPAITSLADRVDIIFPPGIDVTVSITDESGKFPLNTTSAIRWLLLFELMEISTSDASVLTDALLDWIDEDEAPRLNGAESAFYERNDPPYRSKNAPIDDLQELRLIEGFDRLFFDADGVPNDHFRLFSECVTTLDPPAVNYNTANPYVLAVLSAELDFEMTSVSDFLSGPDLIEGTEDDRFLHPALDDDEAPRNDDGQPLPRNVTCRFLTVCIKCSSGGTSFEIVARLDTATPSPDGVYPMTIFDLRTNGSIL